jgi:hypothetical protein
LRSKYFLSCQEIPLLYALTFIRNWNRYNSMERCSYWKIICLIWSKSCPPSTKCSFPIHTTVLKHPVSCKAHFISLSGNQRHLIMPVTLCNHSNSVYVWARVYIVGERLKLFCILKELGNFCGHLKYRTRQQKRKSQWSNLHCEDRFFFCIHFTSIFTAPTLKQALMLPVLSRPTLTQTSYSVFLIQFRLCFRLITL